jgi:hypothetical protein
MIHSAELMECVGHHVRYWLSIDAIENIAGPIAVDLQLVLAIDVSGSVNANEFALQRNGYVNAFQNTVIQNAITAGPLGRIAATYVYWAGAGSQQQTVGLDIDRRRNKR